MPETNPMPEGFHSITPAMVVKDAKKAIQFYKKAFSAKEVMMLTGPNDSVVHAEIKIGDSMIMIGDEWPGHHVQSPATVNGTTLTLHIYVSDVDAAHRQAVAAGAKEVMAPADMFWGDRFSSVMDPYGHSWSLATHVKTMSAEECQAACNEWMAKMSEGN